MTFSKTIIDSMAHLPLQYVSRPDLLKRDLTLQTVKGMGSDEQIITVETFAEDMKNRYLSIPREYYFNHLYTAGYNFIDETSLPELDEPLVFQGELDPERGQTVACSKVLEHFNRNGFGGILKAPPGTGKTVMGLYIAAALNTRTVILVHTDFLRDQWRDRVRTFLGVEPGYIQKDTFDIDKPVVIAMVQSLIKRDYPLTMNRAFGLLISDESHRMGAVKWHKAMLKFNARYRLGLTATPKRKDNLSEIFFWHIGKILHISRPKTLIPVIHQYRTGANLPTWLKGLGRKMRSRMISDLSKDERRTHLIAELLHQSYLAGRKIIVFSERLYLLGRLAEILEEKGVDSVGMYVGGMKEEQRKESAEKQILLSTYQYAREALDIPALDCCFLGTPVAEVEQAVGRILRKHKGKKRPFVVDFLDDTIPYLRGLGFHRRRQYENLGYEIKF